MNLLFSVNKPMEQPLTLLHCGCQKLSFTCVVCKKGYTGRATDPLTTYRPIYHSPPAATYFKYKECTLEAIVSNVSEKSVWCPKAVSQDGVICRRCKLKSIENLHCSGNTDLFLQVLLELKV